MKDGYNKTMVSIKSDKLIEYMQKNNLTSKQFCGLAGISQRELNKILLGKFDFKFISLIKIANFLNISVDWLFKFDENEVMYSFYL